MDNLSKLLEEKKKRELKLKKASEDREALKKRELALQKDLANVDKEIWQARANSFVENIEQEGCNLSDINVDDIDYPELAAFIIDKYSSTKSEDEL